MPENSEPSGKSMNHFTDRPPVKSNEMTAPATATAGSKRAEMERGEERTFLIQIADDGGLESAIRCNKGLKNGVYLYHGILTNKAIGEWFNIPDSDINLIVF